LARIFISYRRNESGAYAARLYDHLSARFGSESVFLDISSVEPGADFAQVIDDAVRSTDAVLVLIGPSWLSPRLQSPEDFIRIEIVAALAAGIPVVPLLLDGARMPSVSELPDDLTELARRQALVLDAKTWPADVERLTHALEGIEESLAPAAEREGPPRRWRQLLRSVLKPAPAPTAASSLAPDTPHDRAQAVSLVMAGVDFEAAAGDLPAVALAVAGVEGGVRDALVHRVEELKRESTSNRAKALSLGFTIEEMVGLEALGAAVESLGDSIRSADRKEREPRYVELFYSYSHRDEELRGELEKHLTILRRQGVIRDWHDRKIASGSEWRGQIDEHLERSQLILLLISADFIASDYCYDIELTRAMERHHAGTARVVPVVLRPVYWKGAPFGELQALPTDARAVTQYANRDEALTIITEGIAEAAASLQAPA
jgi:hypothetical protein